MYQRYFLLHERLSKDAMRFEKIGNRHGLEGYMLLLDLRKDEKCREENVFCVRIKLTPTEKI